MTPPRIAVLALQGDFDRHVAALDAAGARSRPVRRSDELHDFDGLVIPGGESTALLKLMGTEWPEAIGEFHRRGAALFGTCAGAILLAREVQPRQASLGLLDVSIERNAYGRQLDSFETTLDQVTPSLAAVGGIPAVFIRAPRFRRLGASVEVLASHAGDPVLVRQGRVLAATFHPELADDLRIHRHFVALSAESGSAREKEAS